MRATLRDEWAEPAPPPPDKPQYGYAPPPDDCEPPPPRKRRLELAAGDLILFEEILGPKTGDPADADPAHRQVVRLTRVEQSVDELHDQPVLEIEWARED